MKETIFTVPAFSKSRINAAGFGAREKWVLILLASVSGAFLMGLGGLIFSGIGYFDAAINARLDSRIGTWLLMAALPLAMTAAHALDKIGEIDSNKR